MLKYHQKFLILTISGQIIKKSIKSQLEKSAKYSNDIDSCLIHLVNVSI